MPDPASIPFRQAGSNGHYVSKQLPDDRADFLVGLDFPPDIGNVNSTTSSVDKQLAVYQGTSGTYITPSLDTGLAKLAGGVLSAVAAPVGEVVGTTDVQTLTNKTITGSSITGATGITKADVGLSNVDNTSDANKPVSTATQSALNLKQSLSEKGVVNGYPSLDSTGKVPLDQMNASLIGANRYMGTWNAAINSPAIPPATGSNQGQYYTVSTAGSTNIDGISTWAVGDQIISNGVVWQKIPVANAVQSVNGKQGIVVVNKNDVGLGNVDNTSDATKNSAAVTLTSKTIHGANNTLNVRLNTTDVSGSLPTSKLNAGTNASAATFWRGDGQWVAPSGAGDVLGPASSVDSEVVLYSGTTGKTLKRATGTGAANVVNGVWQTPIDLARVGGDPVGTIVTYVGATEPSGWHFCFGQAISRTGIYADLFAAIGTVFGVGDGSTTFNLPDFRGRVDVGRDDMGGTYADRMSLPKTVNTTNASTTLTTTAADWTVGGVQRVAAGMYIYGAGIAAGTTVVSITDATNLVMSAAASATASGITVRFSTLDKLGLGGVGGVMSHALNIAQMPYHNHQVTSDVISGASNTVNAGSFIAFGSPFTTYTGGDQAHTNTQPSSLVNKIIKYATSIAGAITPGTGDVVGPSSAVVDGSLALFDGTTGKQIKSTPVATIVPIGGVVQLKYVEVTSATATGVIPVDGTVPQIGEGTQVASLVITPLYSNSLIRIKVSSGAIVSIIHWISAAVFRSPQASAIAFQGGYVPVAGGGWVSSIDKFDAPGVTSAITYTVRMGPGAAGTVTIGNAGYNNGLTLVLEEIKQ